ncbi:MAG TPA: DUF2795 domain-containing protein [Candidatus Stackebrandtia excrementipullorum]|nr:DUF2795 domain-containing protein [Candidatus Stackebrandtia excrementipullorum]
MVIRRDSQHSRALDDSMAAEARNMRPGASSRSGHWRDPESPVEDEPGGDPLADERVGTPIGMTSQDVEGRFELARYVDTGRFPADAATIREMVVENNAPDTVTAQVSRLPDGRYETVTDVWSALGGGVEERRD